MRQIMIASPDATGIVVIAGGNPTIVVSIYVPPKMNQASVARRRATLAEVTKVVRRYQ